VSRGAGGRRDFLKSSLTAAGATAEEKVIFPTTSENDLRVAVGESRDVFFEPFGESSCKGAIVAVTWSAENPYRVSSGWTRTSGRLELWQKNLNYGVIPQWQSFNAHGRCRARHTERLEPYARGLRRDPSGDEVAGDAGRIGCNAHPPTNSLELEPDLVPRRKP